ncbi:MAG: transposase [Balneolaceae bacterium]|nr:transposase [Balneolaceae bacterium]
MITNNTDWPAATIAELYKRRWQIEIFFKLIKQNLQIKTFLGTTENACKSPDLRGHDRVSCCWS